MSLFFKTTILSGKSFFCFALVLIIFGVSRHLPLDHPSLLNFSPVLAIFLISGAYLRGKLSWIIPIIAVILTDLSLNPNYGVHFFEPFMLVTLFSYLLIFFLGRKTGNQSSTAKILGAGIVSALFFHIFTCSFAWLSNPAYTKSFAGWVQALVFGEPGYAPSYLFLRNLILGTAFFSVIFAYLAKFLSKEQTSQKTESTSGNLLKTH